MRKLFVTLAALALLALPIYSHAGTVTFGALCSGSCSGVQVPDGYGGFTWNGGFYVEGNDAYESGYGNTYGAPSGGGAYNGFGDSPLTINSATPFTFVGADFTTWAEGDAFASFSSQTVNILGFDSSMNLVGGCSQTLSAASYNFLTCNLANVESLVISNDCGNCSGLVVSV